MAQTLNFSIRGLHTFSSDISGVPAGSLSIAKNLDLSKLNLAQCRRGFDFLSLNSDTDRATKLFDYSGYMFSYFDGELSYYDSGWTSVGALTKPTNALVPRSVSMNQNLYITSSSGLKKLDDTGSTLYSAGIPTGLMLELTQSGSTGTAVENGKAVAYRYLIARYDENNNLIFGGVSGREVYTNSSGSTRNVTVKGFLPSGLDNTYLVQIYRSAGVTSPATPNDELQLGYEYPLTTTDVNNGYFTFTDIVPDELLGATIYTAPSQQGIGNDNAQPPLASDIVEFKQFLFYADTESRHRFSFTMISVYDGSSAGELRNGDTITISNGTTTEVYTANSTAANVGTKNFKVDQASSSLSVRIDTTVRSFISVVNQASALVYAYSTSTGSSSLPGGCRLEARSLGSAAFTVVSTRQASFNPQLTPTATVATTSKNDAFRNGLMFSKQGQPEAVPLKNQLKVGSSDDPIKRIIALRDGLLIFKQKDGIYILTGNNESSFSVTPLDSSAKLVSPESLVVLNSQVYGLFESGACSVSDTNVDVLSEPIKDKLQYLFGTCLDQVKDYAFGVAYETDGKYILALPETSGDTYATYQLIYDVFRQEFWEWNLLCSAGLVSSTDGKLYLCSGDKARILKERKIFDYTDFADYEQSSTLSSFVKDDSADTTTLTISGTDEMQPGDLLIQTGVQPSYIQSVNTGVGTAVVQLSQDWDTGLPVLHYKAIECELQWNPDFAGNPAGLKHFSAMNMLFNQGITSSATLSFSSDLNPGVSTITITGSESVPGWGYTPWDEGVWGGEQSGAPVRVGVPKPNARCTNLTINFSIRIAMSDWTLAGVALDFNPTSTRTNG